MGYQFAAVNTFQEPNAVFGGSGIFRFNGIPQAAVFQTIIFLCIFKSLCTYKLVYFLHTFFMIVITVEIADQFICGFVIADGDHFI